MLSIFTAITGPCNRSPPISGSVGGGGGGAGSGVGVGSGVGLGVGLALVDDGEGLRR